MSSDVNLVRVSPLASLMACALCACGAGSGGDTGLPRDGGSGSTGSATATGTGSTGGDGAVTASDAAVSDATTDQGTDSAVMCALSPTTNGTCNAVALQGTSIGSTCSTAAMPTPTGGAIQDGLYVLQSVTFYGSCPAAPRQERITWAVCGSTWETAQETTPDAGASTLRVSITPTIQGTSIQTMIDCISTGATGAGPTWGYTASPSSLVLYVPNGTGSLIVDSYARH